MTFNPSVPLNSDSPSIFPAQNQTNMSRLQTIIGADHQLNLTAAANDGYHNIVHLTQQAPAGVLAATGRFFAKSSASRIHAFYMDDTGAEYQMSPTMPIRAAVNFSESGSRRSFYNVSSVTKNGDGDYTVNFTTALPNTDYIVHVTGMRNTNAVIIGCVEGNATYSNSVTINSVRVNFYGAAGDLRAIIMGNVTIFSAT